MRLIFWVTALAVLSVTCAKNSTAKTKPKRQLENIRTPQNLQYSLVLPHSRVQHFRSTSSNRRISNVPRGKLPPYAVQMEPVVQYSQKDPLYDPNLSNLDEAVGNKNEIHAQPKILNIHDQSPEGSFGPPYGALPTAPLYSYEPQPHYIEAPEPIIEIIIKESNESLPAPPPQPILKKKKEPVQVFYVKYSKDPHSEDKVVYEKPIPAITPPSNHEEDSHDDYITVTPEPLYLPTQTTTLRAIIKPESEVYHSDSSVKVTFGNENHHHYSSREDNGPHEHHEETAPRPAIALPNAHPSAQTYEHSASPQPQYHDSSSRSISHSSPLADHSSQTYRSASQHAQSRIQFQQSFLSNDYQLPRQGPSVAPFRSQPQSTRQSPFPPSPSVSSYSGFPSASPSSHFANVAPTVPGPISPAFPTTFSRPSNPPSFHARPSSPPAFASRPHFGGPPRTSFHSGPQRPFHQQQPQPQTYFDEPKYLQENYHTITTEQVEPPKVQLLPTRQAQTFNPKPSPSTSSAHFSESRPQLIPYNQQLPTQQRPSQHFDSGLNSPSFSVSPSRPPFYNLKPSPPHIENNRVPFQSSQQQTQQFSFHQGAQPVVRPTLQSPTQHSSFSSHISPSPSPIPHNQFLPQPSSPPLFSFHPQPSPTPSQQHSFHQQPLNHYQHSQTQTERPPSGHQTIFQSQTSLDHQQNIGQFVPKDGELVPSISKYEQHITVDGRDSRNNFEGLNDNNQPAPTSITPQQQFYQQQQQQHRHQQQQEQKQKEEQEKQQQQQAFDAEQEQVRQQLAQNVRKQQEEIQRLQGQLLYNQQLHHQQQQQQQTKQFEQNQYNQYNNYDQQERSRAQPSFVSSTQAPFYQSTSRTVEIKPTTPKYVSSTSNSLPSTPEPKKEEKKKKPTIELPDEVPDDLRQQLLSSGILDNADISVLDYDKVGETPLESLPPDQLANFFSAGGGQQIAASDHNPVVVKPNRDQIESRIDENFDEDDQDIAASENMATYVSPPSASPQAVDMKVVQFDPNTPEGKNIAKDYVKEDATQVDPVALNDKKYNRYLPLKVKGNQFPLPDILKGRKITSVVVLAPVQTEELSTEHSRAERATTNSLKGIKFVAGDSLQDLLKKPTTDNFNKWLDIEKKTATDQQSVILLVTENDEPAEDKEIFMYDISSGTVSKLSGELSNAFVEAAENNSLSKDIEKLAIEGDGTPENFDKEKDPEAEGSENVPLFVDLSGISLDQEDSKVSITSGYSKTKLGRSLRRQ